MAEKTQEEVTVAVTSVSFAMDTANAINKVTRVRGADSTPSLPLPKRFKSDEDTVKSVSYAATATTARSSESSTCTADFENEDKNCDDADNHQSSDYDDNDNDKNYNDDNNDQEDGDTASAASPSRGIPVECEGLESAESEVESVGLDSATTGSNEERNAMLRRILAAAAAQGIPLEFLACIQSDDDDEPVNYPFEEPPNTIKDIATFIQSSNCKKIVVLAGAGMSVASGIPDFRSPDGLYATLQADNLTATQDQRDRIRLDPSYSLDQHLFMENPLPCLEVNREFVLGIQSRKWKATLAHRFVELLEVKTGKLCRLYTQNIDGLEDQCGLPHDKRIAVHGSMDEASCAVCQHDMSMEEFCQKLKSQIKDITGKDSTAPKESSPILCQRCHAPAIKPNIVLFRSSLPKEFFQKVPVDTKDADLLIIIGTSLGVAPANSLVWRVPRSCMRVLINREAVGWHLGLDFDENGRDFFAGGDCEAVVLELMDHLGWLQDLTAVINELPESSGELLREVLNRRGRRESE